MAEIICPYCEEGKLEKMRCTACRKVFLICDECESIYRDRNSLEDELPAGECPFCGNPMD